MHIVIVGNGAAGIEAALTVRQREADWSITIVSEESDHFFSRPALMYAMCGQLGLGDIEPYERDLYERMRFNRVRSRVVAVDPVDQEVRLGDGKSMTYDRLLLACGSRPRPGVWPNSDLRGIGHFVTLQDLEWLEREVYGASAERPPEMHERLAVSAGDSPYRPRETAAGTRGRLGRKALVAGGGLIGIEVVEILRQAGVEVHFLIMEGWYWPTALNRREARWVAGLMEEEGVRVHFETVVDRFVDDGSGVVGGVRTKVAPPDSPPDATPDETWKEGPQIDCDLAVISIGVVPNTDWLEGSGIELDQESAGIAVDGELTTNYPDVFAAGDCAAVRWFDGSVRPEQLWYTARDQGRVAGRRLLGDEADYERGTFYNSAKFMDIEYTTAGLVNFGRAGEEEWVYEEKAPVRSMARIVHRDDQVTGFNMLGRRWDHRVLVRWIEERRSLDWVLDRLNEAAFDAEFTPPLAIPGREPPQKTLWRRLFA